MSHKEDFLQSCLVLDTETNSDDYKIAEIIESGFVIREGSDWTIFQELHKPIDRPIPPKVESICYITNKMVEDKPSFIDSKEVFQEVINGYAAGYLVAHNHFYDMRVLERHGIDTSNHNWICTWRMAKKLFNGMESIEETNLPYLRFALELDVPIEMRCHRAGNDSYMTAKLLEVFVDIMEVEGLLDKELPYGPQIMKWTFEPIIYERMPFGKHKNELMTAVPHSYWQWAMRNTDWFDEEADNYDPDLAASIHKALGID
jgi:DNA polymerase III epsilon subunit-like protein